MTEFKVGDRVRVVDGGGHPDVKRGVIKVGEEGVIADRSVAPDQAPIGDGDVVAFRHADGHVSGLWLDHRFELIKGDKLGRDVINVGDTVEFLEHYGSVSKGTRVVVRELEEGDLARGLDVIRYDLPNGCQGAAYKRRFKKVFPGDEEKNMSNTFKIGDVVEVTEDNPESSRFVRGEKLMVHRLIGGTTLVLRREGETAEMSSSYVGVDYVRHLRTKFVTLDEAWQEGNVIEFTADAVRDINGDWKVGCKRIHLADGLESGIVRSVVHVSDGKAEVRFRVKVPGGALLRVEWSKFNSTTGTAYKSQISDHARDFEIIEKAPEKTVTVELTQKEVRALRDLASATTDLGARTSAYRKLLAAEDRM